MGETLVELRAARIPGWSGLVADHHWLLILTGVVGRQYQACDRWEIWQHPNQNQMCWGHLHKNLLRPCQDVGNGKSRSVKIWDGDDAKCLIHRLEQSPQNYPYNDFYRYWPGPNSNTFAQWIVRDKMRLGRRAVGKWFPMPKTADNKKLNRSLAAACNRK